jgi:geranylgeranylglycerol-phosphate geranylgeranyltransferase
MGKVGAFLRLTRIEHSIMLVVAVLAAELISGGLPPAPVLLLSLVAPILISMSSFAINDYFDVKSDTINRRFDRPLVSGEISRGTALWIAAFTLVAGVGAGALINSYAFAIALAFGALAMLYSYRLKDVMLLGNVYIAFSMAIPFVFGNFVYTRTLEPSIIIIFFIIFLSGLAREIHGMIRDYRGDSKARKTKNLIRYIGSRTAAMFAFVLYLEAVILSLFLFFFTPPFRYNAVYLLPILATDLMLVYVSLVYAKGGSAGLYRLSRDISLAAMGIALLAFLLSPLVSVIV